MISTVQRRVEIITRDAGAADATSTSGTTRAA
jgi:hypothetical protein